MHIEDKTCKLSYGIKVHGTKSITLHYNISIPCVLLFIFVSKNNFLSLYKMYRSPNKITIKNELVPSIKFSRMISDIAISSLDNKY